MSEELDHLKINEKKNRKKNEEKNYIKRIKNGNTFRYTYKDNRPVNDKNTLEKISKIYIAPAYRNVKIFLDNDLLAVGIDDKGRKQYVYSDEFKKQREKKKYCQLMTLSGKIERLKAKISSDLKMEYFTKDKLVALVLRIMDLCNFRSGQRKMEKKYKSHGITTVHKNHVKMNQNKVEIGFIGKKGVENHCVIQDKPIQEIVRKVYKMSTNKDPYLFSIKSEKNEMIHVTIDDLNNYLRPFEVTTKDLRTWNANIIFLKSLYYEIDVYEKEYEKMKNPTEPKKLKLRKKIVREAIKRTAVLLHNTPSVCRSSYIYKNIVQEFENNEELMDKVKTFNNKNFKFESYLSSLLKDMGTHGHCNIKGNKKNNNKKNENKNKKEE